MVAELGIVRSMRGAFLLVRSCRVAYAYQTRALSLDKSRSSCKVDSTSGRSGLLEHMKRLIVAAGLNAAVLLALAPSSLAATVTFTGIVDEIQGHPPGVAIGDTFSGIFFSIRIHIFRGGLAA